VLGLSDRLDAVLGFTFDSTMTGWCALPDLDASSFLMDDSRPVFFSQFMYAVIALSVCQLRNCCFTNLDLWIRFV